MDERIAPAPDPTRSRSAARAPALLASLAALLAFAGNASAADHPVSLGGMFGNAFSPSSVTITAGDRVVWTNLGGTHNVHFDGEATGQPGNSNMGSPAGMPPWPVTRTFSTPGTFTYFCNPHQALGMTGSVTVLAAAPPPGGGGGGGGTPPPPGGTPTPPPGGDPSPPGSDKTRLRLTLKLSDATPRRGSLVRFFGSVRPAIEGRVLIQRRVRNRYRTVTRITLKDGRGASTFSKRLRAGAGVYRARILANAEHEAANSSTKRIRVG